MQQHWNKRHGGSSEKALGYETENTYSLPRIQISLKSSGTPETVTLPV